MKVAGPLRRHGWETLLALVLVLPWLSLLAFGMVWLWQGGHVLVWASVTAVLGLLTYLLWQIVRRRTKEEVRLVLGEMAEPSRNWSSTEQAAWAHVLAIADATVPLSFTEGERLVAIGRETVEAVARHFHPDVDEPWAQFKLPEALLLAERLCRDLRREALRHIPGVRAMRLGHLLWIHRQSERYGATAQTGWRVGYGLWRVARAALNPVQAVVQEVKDLVMDETRGVLSYRLRAYATRLFVLEVGRAAIDLFSGRLSLSDEEVRAARERDMAGTETAPEVPVRILLAGQTSAGKSSLLNAMAKEVRAAVGPMPTTSGSAEHRVDLDGRPALVLVDTAGLSERPETAAGLLRQAERADLIVWVGAATQPARNVDKSGLDALRSWSRAQLERRPPPILLALTHVDQLRPVGEWLPPYDVTTPRRPKARAIRAAIDAASRTLDLPADAVVPVAMPPGREPYNIDALWARIALALDEAKLVQLDRLRVDHRSLGMRELADQIGNTGRLIIKGITKT